MMRKLTKFTATCALALAPCAAMADQSSLYDFITSTMGDIPVTDATYRDMNGDGGLEALVTTAQCNDDGCDWRAFSNGPDGPMEIGRSHGPDPKFSDTSGDTSVITSGGVVWAYTGQGQIFPWNSVLENIRSHEPDAQERQILADHFGFPADEMKVAIYDVALFGNGMNQHVAWISGFCCSGGTAGRAFAVLNGAGEILMSGYSQDIPRIYKDGAGGARIVANTPAGYALTHIAATDAAEPSSQNE